MHKTLMSAADREGTTKVGASNAVAHEHVLFTHSEKCDALLKALLSPFANIHSFTGIVPVDWSACNEFCKILEIYQEQGHLLDPHLESMVSPLLAAIQRCSRDIAMAQQCSGLLSAVGKCVYALSKVRGYKVVTKFFPHEAIDLEGCLLLLALTLPSNYESWELRFALFLWLSVLLLVPFNLASLDNKEDGQPLIDRLVRVCEGALSESSRTREPAALSLSRLLTRADTEANDLPAFLKRANAVISGSVASDALYDTRTQGFLAAVAAVFKRGDRAGLLKRVPMVLVRTTDVSLFATASTGLRKMMIKAAARMGLAMLPSRVATWRYDRGSRSLEASLSSTARPPAAANSAASTPAAASLVAAAATCGDDQHDDAYVFIEVDRIADALLRGLDDKDTVVRWSAAKGIGRITGRLPGHLADEIVLETLQLISNLRSDCAWHGACLALAELARRGLLLPVRLDASVSAVEQALVYDERRGNASVGSHVRDAACYVCWGFARAYEPALLAPFLKRLSVALLQTALYDREVNCRRAASAAFQEMVGRQGSFAHGIDITQRADFFSLSNRHAAFTDIAQYVAEFEDYRLPLLERVSSAPLIHWDIAIRHLAAEGLCKLVPLDIGHTLTSIMPRLAAQVTDSDICVRHGCIIGLAAIVKAATVAPVETPKLDCILSTATSSFLSCCSNQIIRSRGSELTRQAVCSLVCSLCVAASHLDDHVFDTISKFVQECVLNAADDVRASGLAALRSLRTHFEQRPHESNSTAVFFIENASQLGVGTMEARAGCRGSIASLALLPLTIMPTELQSRVLQVVCDSAKGVVVSSIEIVDIETRSIACESLSALVESGALVRDFGHVAAIMASLYAALNDYSVDKRGDIGSLVRESAMSAFLTVLSRLLRAPGNAEELFSGTLAVKCILSIFRQCFEKIDRVRAHAGGISSQLCSLSHVKQLFPICSKYLSSQSIDWINATSAFSSAAGMLSEESARQSLCEGIVVSCGGVGESVARGGWSALKTWLTANKGQQCNHTCVCIVQLLSTHQSCDRIIMPTLRLLNIMLSDGDIGACISELNEGAVLTSCIDWVCSEAKKSSDVSKLCALIDVLAACSGLKSIFTLPCIKYMTITLAHRLPRVRCHCADALYTALLSAEALAHDALAPDSGADVDGACVALASASWGGSIAEVKAARAEVAVALSIELPVAVVTDSKKASSGSLEKGEGYGTLVRDMGY